MLRDSLANAGARPASAADAPASRSQDAFAATVCGDLARKRRLLDDMETMRGGPAFTRPVPEAPVESAPSVPSTRAAGPDGSDGSDEAWAALQARVHAAESTCALLEEEIERLERQTLEAMAESGRLRRALDDMERAGLPDGESTDWRRERMELHRRLNGAERERELLTSALADSEAEIARLTKTLGLVARKLNLAG